MAFAREHGVLSSSGVLLMCWAAGSLGAGLVAGPVTWRRTPLARWRVGAVALAVTLLPLPFVGPAWLLGALLAVSGVAIAPTLIASVSVVQTSVPPVRLTEALGWSSTGISAGVAAGAALGGAVVDRAGSVAGFTLVAGFGLLLVVGVLLVADADDGGSGAGGPAAEVALEGHRGLLGHEARGPQPGEVELLCSRPRRELLARAVRLACSPGSRDAAVPPAQGEHVAGDVGPGLDRPACSRCRCPTGASTASRCRTARTSSAVKVSRPCWSSTTDGRRSRGRPGRPWWRRSCGPRRSPSWCAAASAAAGSRPARRRRPWSGRRRRAGERARPRRALRAAVEDVVGARRARA